MTTCTAIERSMLILRDFTGLQCGLPASIAIVVRRTSLITIVMMTQPLSVLTQPKTVQMLATKGARGTGLVDHMHAPRRRYSPRSTMFSTFFHIVFCHWRSEGSHRGTTSTREICASDSYCWEQELGGDETHLTGLTLRLLQC